jgi:ADP-dependent NAD(P)H-hydrate dehydratase / NAD(P)H-hydrate epimerase
MSDLIVSAAEMRDIEQAAFDDGVEAEKLMDRAGEGIAAAIIRMVRRPGTCIAYLGKGNNAGDAIVAAVHLGRAGWRILTRMLSPDLHSLPRKKLFTLTFENLDSPVDTHFGDAPTILLDGILGIGSRRSLSPDIRAMTQELNSYRLRSNAVVFAMDLPTGVGEEGVDVDAVVADVSLTVGLPKKALFRDDATNQVGRIVTVVLDELKGHDPVSGDHAIFSGPDNLRHLAPKRPFDSHKGTFGRIGIVAGSKGFAGAAILCSEAAARAGAGLVSLYVPKDIYELVVPNITPEIMVKATADFRTVLEDRLDAIGLGPGLGQTRPAEVLSLFQRFSGPMVVDADALNILSKQTDLLAEVTFPRLLTPHPGEMARLFPANGKSRAEIVREFTNKFPVTLLLKGARTLVGSPNKPLAYNSTGSPGLATGGSGDVLTGICAALLGRGLSVHDAGRLGAWIHGRSAELALSDFSEESLLPSDLFAYFGDAFRELRNEKKF